MQDIREDLLQQCYTMLKDLLSGWTEDDLHMKPEDLFRQIEAVVPEVHYKETVEQSLLTAEYYPPGTKIIPAKRHPAMEYLSHGKIYVVNENNMILDDEGDETRAFAHWYDVAPGQELKQAP